MPQQSRLLLLPARDFYSPPLMSQWLESCRVLDFRVLLPLLLVAICLSGSSGGGSDVPLRPRDMVALLEDGRRQYNLVQARTSMPSFGTCWKTAVSRLHAGCQHLDDGIQSGVALGFANCFLEGAGLPRHNCDADSDAGFAPKESCLKGLSDRAFIAYTEFFTHTQSMCFFIMSQIWHEETEKTIDKLSTSAADVARQLEASEELQEELLLHQKRSVAVQQELLENGVTLGSMLHESRDSLNLIFTEFRASTLEQQRLLSMVFHHLSSLQSWIVGEVSWVDSIAFYIPSCAFVYFLTSAQRTSNARIPGLLVLVLSGLLERFISYILLNDGADTNSFQPVDIVNERLSWWVWLVRRCAIATNIMLLSVTLYRYKNREEVMHQLLEQIRRQNEELLKHIHGKPLKINLNWTKLIFFISVTVTSNGSTVPKKFKPLDEADGFGYMPLLTSSSSSLLSTPRLRESPITTVKPAVSVVSVPLQEMSSPIRRISIPTSQSAFKPIREDSIDDTFENSSVVEHATPSSTPRSKNRKRAESGTDVSVFDTPVSTRYNLRRSKSSAVSPV
ncbi:hypothetical protein ONE63_005389 [Megalurothrips usitatus]|uniref:Protein brambleberry-like n=1 Tax=Megalurothrips usitatus TaxID=439358 RepID=A0AAV7XYH6_9NEOP|nr:hypothetical protein ONE63_005389 [Megalurothrips usitatus]